MKPSFDDELGAAFAETASVTGTRFKLSNTVLRGTISRSGGSTPLREPGFEPMDTIEISVPVSVLTVAPDPALREIVQVMEGPHAGRWVLVGIQSDAGHHYLTCEPSE